MKKNKESKTLGAQKTSKGVHKNIGGKIIIKGATQVNGHPLKLYFCMFEKSQGKHNSLDFHFFGGIFSINCKFYMVKA
jgi:hypothetical protein